MHNITYGIIIALTATACSGGNKYISESDFENYEYTDTAEADTAEVEDTGTVEETDTQDTEDTEETDLCQNDYHPIHTSGWTKTFSATYEGSVATATEVGLGPVQWNGQTVYAYKDTMSATESGLFGPIQTGWDTTVYVSCDFDGEEGMFMRGWEGSATQKNFLGFPTSYEVEATLSPYRRYLSPEYAVGAEGSWSYDYQLNINAVENQCIDGQDNDFDGAVDAADPDCANSKKEDGSPSAPQVQSEQVSGSYLDAGFENITILAGTAQQQTVMAYKVVNTVTQTDRLGQPSESYIEQYWVKGLGMVKEDFLDATGSIVLSKELSAMTGLTAIQ
jgi:hypothetical protein